MRERKHEFSAVDGLRGRQDLGRGRRRHRRGDRLPGVLRARDAALRAASSRSRRSGRGQRARLHPARRRRGHPAVELPARDPGRHDDRRGRHRQHASCSSRRPTRRRSPPVRRAARRGRPAAGRRQLRHRRAAARSAMRWSQHPQTRFISFTGSKEVGLRINERGGQASARARSGSSASSPRWAARTRSSSTTTADLDAAAAGVVAVGVRLPGPEVLGLLARDRRRGGLRRVRAEDRRADEEAAASAIRPTRDDAHRARWSTRRRSRRSASYIENGHEGRRTLRRRRQRATARTATSSSRPSSPTSRPTRRIAQEEIFGPVLAVIKAKDFDDALAIANDTEYGLTGAVFTDERGEARARRATSSTSATCTSTASAPARWSACIRSAAST